MTGAFHFGRHRVIGLIGIVIAAILFGLVSSRIALDKISTLRITWPGAKPTDPPLLDIPLPTVIAVGVIAALLVAGGLYLIVWQRSNTVPYYMGALIFATILIILIWASAGNRVDMVDMLARMVRLATPIALGALAGILCERSGVVNIAIEGLMLMGACIGFIVALLTGGSWLLAWSAFDGQDDEIVWARRAGNAWQPVQRLSAGNSVPDITPALTATADGGALIAWNHFDGKGYELRTARFQGEGWRDERAAAPAGSLFPKFLGGSRLLYVNAVPHAWTVLDLDAAGRVKARATVPSPLDRPVVTFEGSTVRMRWPAEKRQAAASLERVP